MRDSPYIGQPGNISDGSWNNLFANMSIRVTEEELSSRGQSSVALPGGGYLAWLGVYHELHCVKVLRKMIYRDHFYPNTTQEEFENHQVHADHCVDMLRQALLCHGDMETLTTFVWDRKYNKPLLSPQRPLHTCLDWSSIMITIADRIVSEGELNQLQMF